MSLEISFRATATPRHQQILMILSPNQVPSCAPLSISVPTVLARATVISCLDHCRRLLPPVLLFPPSSRWGRRDITEGSPRKQGKTRVPEPAWAWGRQEGFLEVEGTPELHLKC